MSTEATVNLSTERLELEWLSADRARAILDHDPEPDWGEGFPTPGDLIVARRILEDSDGGPHDAPFLCYLVRERRSGKLIGGAGFHGRPKDRAAEIGYGFAPAFRGHGYATEACGALVEAAVRSGRVDVLIATTEQTNGRSQSVLRHAGFRPVNETATRWVLRVRPRPATGA